MVIVCYFLFVSVIITFVCHFLVIIFILLLTQKLPSFFIVLSMHLIIIGIMISISARRIHENDLSSRFHILSF